VTGWNRRTGCFKQRAALNGVIYVIYAQHDARFGAAWTGCQSGPFQALPCMLGGARYARAHGKGPDAPD